MTTTATEWETVIGLEVHCELATETKLFCSCPNDFGAEPNTYVCPVCLGLPGSLPVLNQRAVEFALRVGEALHCEVADESIFHRKNYFYPDMPASSGPTSRRTPVRPHTSAGEAAASTAPTTASWTTTGRACRCWRS
jgi:Asp-tRNA(Asn)/Glu-tRNA(Gln) amidotransferase B subunit